MMANEQMSTMTTPIMAADRIITMAKQIGDFFAPYPQERRTEGVRNHLRTYWDPRMRDELFALSDSGTRDLPAHVIDAAMLLRENKHSKPGYYGPPKA